MHLADLGTSEAYVSKLATDFVQSGLFRVLSAEGIDRLCQEVQRLEHLAVVSPRIPRVLRGASMRSRFIHGLCHSPELAAFMSKIAKTELVAHPMEIMNSHINFAPKDNSVTVDRWHRDTTQFVLVVFCTPPEEYEGGEFEFFAGTVEEAEALLKAGEVLPEERCKLLGQQERGFAVLQQGSEVYHRVRPVRSGPRATFVQSFVPTDVRGREACESLSDTYNGVDPLDCLLPDWARYRCWRASRLCEVWLELESNQAPSREAVLVARQKLRDVVEFLPYTADRQSIAEMLSSSVHDLRCLTSSAHGTSRGGQLGASGALLEDAAHTVERAVHDVLHLRESTMSYF